LQLSPCHKIRSEKRKYIFSYFGRYYIQFTGSIKTLTTFKITYYELKDAGPHMAGLYELLSLNSSLVDAAPPLLTATSVSMH
jgi:hypothetical protein